MRFELGLPFMGVFVYGIIASLIVLLLDILGPLAFLYALWKRKSWGPAVAYAYMGVFILSSIIAFFTVREQLGTIQVLIPMVVTLIFVSVIYNSKDYFK